MLNYCDGHTVQKNQMTQNLIDTEKELSTLCDHLEKESVIAVDTECIRERTYYPVPALLQIATAEDAFVIDLATIPNLSVLNQILANPEVTKIIHSGKQDYQIFKLMNCSFTMPVFDTQVASAFLALKQQISYKELIQECLGITLDKSCTRSNWLQRPLSDEQYQYAIADVSYLIQAHAILKNKLEEKNRLDWVMEENARILKSYQYEIDLAPEKMTIKVSGKKSIESYAQHKRLKQLTTWREHKAQLTDLPRRWVLADAELVTLATDKNMTPTQIQHILKKCPDQCRREWQEEISDLLKSVDNDSQPIKRNAPNLSQQKQIETIVGKIKKLSAQHHIEQTLIGNRKEVTQWVMNSDEQTRNKFTQSWRKHILSNVLT